MTHLSEKSKKRNEWVNFLHNIQKPKMKELCDNKADEAWDFYQYE